MKHKKIHFFMLKSNRWHYFSIKMYAIYVIFVDTQTGYRKIHIYYVQEDKSLFRASKIVTWMRLQNIQQRKGKN